MRELKRVIAVWQWQPGPRAAGGTLESTCCASCKQPSWFRRRIVRAVCRNRDPGCSDIHHRCRTRTDDASRSQPTPVSLRLALSLFLSCLGWSQVICRRPCPVCVLPCGVCCLLRAAGRRIACFKPSVHYASAKHVAFLRLLWPAPRVVPRWAAAQRRAHAAVCLTSISDFCGQHRLWAGQRFVITSSASCRCGRVLAERIRPWHPKLARRRKPAVRASRRLVLVAVLLTADCQSPSAT